MPSQEFSKPSKFYLEAMDRLSKAAAVSFTKEEVAGFEAIEKAMGGGVFLGDPEGR